MSCCCLNFTIEECLFNFKLQNSTLSFDADLGYVGGNLSYIPLTDKPQINYRTLESGNNTYEYLGIQEQMDDITNQEIDNIIYGG